MASELEKMLGESLVSGGGESIRTAEALAGKEVVLLYFSAHWCPPCRGFTPVLAEAYKAYKASGGAAAEVVFVSWDRSPPDFETYFGEMPWLSIPFDSPIRETLGPRFEVEGIPSLVALAPDGTRLHGEDSGTDLRQLVSLHKGAAFPFTPARLAALDAEREQAQAAILKELSVGTLFPPVRAPGASTAEVSVADLLGGCEHLALLAGDGDGSDDTYKAVARVQVEVNAAGEDGARRFEVLYLGWSLYNESSDHAPLAKDYYALTDPSQELKDKLSQLCKTGMAVPQVLVLTRDKEGAVKIVSSDPGARRLQTRGAQGYPWSDEKEAELAAAHKARVEALKASQVNLQFLKAADGGRDGLPTKDGAEVKVDTLAAAGSDAIVALYFSAHWCGPCRGFTPELAKCYNELKAAGKPFEVVFVSGDKDEESFKEYFAEMPWLALPFGERDLSRQLNSVFEVQGIPSLVLLKADGTFISSEGRNCVSVGAEFFPWGPSDMERGKKALEEKRKQEQEAAVSAEKAADEDQRARGVPVLTRIRGVPGVSVTHDVAAKTVMFKQFATVGVPDLSTPSGVLYYELEVLEAPGGGGIPQFGFATSAFKHEHGRTGEGVGDDDDSWGVDGVRGIKWHAGDHPWACGWAVGDVVGFAANVGTGKIAVSKNGSWTDAPCGVVFESEKIKGGVYPAMTGGGYKVRYAFAAPFTHGPPLAEFWG